MKEAKDKFYKEREWNFCDEQFQREKEIKKDKGKGKADAHDSQHIHQNVEGEHFKKQNQKARERAQDSQHVHQNVEGERPKEQNQKSRERARIDALPIDQLSHKKMIEEII